jgi:GNAT superfamily N-acetyltransferase
MDIRPITPDDLPQLLDLVQGLAKHHGDTPTASLDSLSCDLFGPVPWAQGLVADEDGILQAYALLMPLMRAHFGQRGMDLHHLFVAEPARGAGLGTAMIRAVRAHVLGQSCDYLTVSTQEANAEARDFYIHHGFSAAPPSPWRYAMDLSRG